MRWGIATLLLAWSSVAVAQPASVTSGAGVSQEPAGVVLGYGAMPGGMRAPSAGTLPRSMFGVSLIGGFGIRNKLLSEDHKMSRGIGDIAFAYAPTDTITLGLAFDGRFDKHTGLTAGGDDGYVGDPRLIARFGKQAGKLTGGGQLTVLVPGKDAPSVAFDAISVEARGLLTLAAGPGALSLAAGFRLDNSAKSVVDDNGDDNRMLLTAEDRVSLGVSDFNAVIASAHYQLPLGPKAYLGVEGSLDLFLGSDDFGHDAPGPIIRAGATGGFHLNQQWTAFAFLQLAKVPKLDFADVTAGDIILIPYEPALTGGVAIAAQFGGPRRGSGGNGLKDRPDKIPVSVDVLADLSGVVTDDTGKPMAGAKVSLKTKNKTGSTVTDGNGEWTVKGVPIGKTIDGKTTLDDTGAEITVEVEGKKPKVTTLTLAAGANKVETITLDPTLPPGQFKAVVRAAGTGKPLANITVRLEPGGTSAVSDDQGNVSIDVQPGTYKATAVGAGGYKDQTLENIVIEQATVNVKQFELRK